MAPRCESFYPTDDDVRRYRAAALRRLGRRLSPDEARRHLLRWRRFAWANRPGPQSPDAGPSSDLAAPRLPRD